MIKRFFNHQTTSLGFSAGILAISALLSNLLGLLRDRLLANRFGAGETLDVYFASFRIPDFIYGVLIAGGIISVFLPIFSEYFQKGEKEGWKFSNTVINCFLVLLLFLCFLLAVFAPFLVKLMVPGFSPAKKALTTALTRIMLFSPFFFVLSSIFSGILLYFNRFLVYSIAPLLYNLGIIFGILFLVPLFGIYGLAFGVVFGAFLHLISQVLSAKLAGFKYQFSLNFRDSGLKEIFFLTIPRSVSTIINHLNLIFITAIASTLSEGSLAIFNFSNNLQKFPTIFIGTSLATASFVVLAKSWAENKKEKFLENLAFVFRQILFLIVPISFLIYILRAQLVRLILGSGEFGWLETRLTAASLGIFALGILGSCLITLILRVFYSLPDTKTPMKIGFLSVLFNIVLCFGFIFLLRFPNVFQTTLIKILRLQGIKNIQVISLPLAFSLTAIFQFSLLFYCFSKKISTFSLELNNFWKEKISQILSSLKKVILATILMATLVHFLLKILANFVNMQTFLGIFLQTFVAGLFGVLVYIFFGFYFKSPEMKVLKRTILRKIGYYKDAEI